MKRVFSGVLTVCNETVEENAIVKAMIAYILSQSQYCAALH